MRKKLDTRFPAARIKKIMQTDEDVGKIALAVPLLVSKALELFLQDLCDRTYEITLHRGAKTINSLHLRQCVHSFNMFDFLKDTVSKVPELGGSESTSEDRSATKRRKVVDCDENGSGDEELKRSKTHDSGHSTGSVRGRGRGRGRGRPRGSRTRGREAAATHGDKDEYNTNTSKHNENNYHDESLYDDDDDDDDKVDPEAPKKNMSTNENAEATVRNFDLNVDLNESGDLIDNGDSAIPLIAAAPDEVPPMAPDEVCPVGPNEVPPVAPDEVHPVAPDEVRPVAPESKHVEYPGWSLADMEEMAIDPRQLANLSRVMDVEDEDYDEED